MPVFLFLSGLLVPSRLARSQMGFVKSLWPAIVLPYFLWCTIQSGTIYVMGRYVNVPLHAWNADTLIGFLWAPASQFWFLYVLFIYHIGSLIIGTRAGWLALFVASIALYQLAGPVTAISGQICHFMIFYALGTLVGSSADLSRWQLSRRGDAALAIAAGLAVIIASTLFGERAGLAYLAPEMFAAGVAGVPLVIGIASLLPQRATQLFVYLGQRAMPIFILHVLFVAGLRILLHKILGLQVDASTLLLLVPGGIVGPLVVFAVAKRLGLSGYLGLGGVPKRATR